MVVPRTETLLCESEVLRREEHGPIVLEPQYTHEDQWHTVWGNGSETRDMDEVTADLDIIAPDTLAIFQGMEAYPELNGSAALVVEFHLERLSYSVDMGAEVVEIWMPSLRRMEFDTG